MNYPMSIEATAEMFVRSGMFPDLKSQEQAATLLIIGRGFNISDYDSVTGLYLRQGKVNMHANVMGPAASTTTRWSRTATSSARSSSSVSIQPAGIRLEAIGLRCSKRSVQT